MGCGINDYVNKLTAELDKRKGSSHVAAAMLNELGKIGQSKIEEYEVSSAGDKRFSALYAKFKDGETIELKWAKAKGYKTIAEAKNKPALTKNFDYKTTYFNLWKEWSKENSKLIEDLRVKSEGKKLVDKFAKTENNQAAALTEILGQLNLLKNGKSESADKSDEIAKVNKGTTAEKHTAKELIKAKMANKYIGKGSVNSSTYRYMQVYGDKANMIEYTADDVVWVSSNGKRNGRVDPLGPDGIKTELDSAIDAGATIVMDTEAHIGKTGGYNIGEKALEEYMLSKGYTRDSSSGAGVWTKQTTEMKLVKDSKTGLLGQEVNGKFTNTVKVGTYEQLVELTKQYSKLLRKSLDSKDSVYYQELFDDITKSGFGFKPITVKFENRANIFDKAQGNAFKDERVDLSVDKQEGDAHPVKLVLHEYAHIITAQELKKYPNLMKRTQQIMDNVREANPNIVKANPYAFTNEFEFIAEVVSSPKLQHALNKLTSDGVKLGLGDKVVKIFKNLLSRLTGKYDSSTLTDALEVVVALQEGKDAVVEQTALDKYLATYGGTDDISWMQEDETKPDNHGYEAEKPFETGVHAEQHPELVEKIPEQKIEVEASVFKGKYNSKYDKTRPAEVGAMKKVMQGQVNTETNVQKENDIIKGAAIISEKKILIDIENRSTDTLSHEYAHLYIAGFRDTPIGQEAIKKWGGEEALVQAIDEQVIKQKGEVYGWWKKFSKWVKDIFSNLDKFSKKELVEILTDGFLTATDIKKATEGYYENYQSSAVNNLVNNVYMDKGIVTNIQEFIEYSESVFKDSKVEYIVTHSTGEPFDESIETAANVFIEEYPDEAADYINKLLSTNYDINDIFYSTRESDGTLSGEITLQNKIEKELKENNIDVYYDVADHFKKLYSNKTSWVYKEEFSKDKVGTGIGGNYAGTGFYFYGITGQQFPGYEIVAKLNITDLSEYNDKKWKEKGKDGYIGEIGAIADKGQVEIVVTEPEQIHIFGSDKDIKMFKKWKLKQETDIILPNEIVRNNINRKIECKE